MDTNMDRLAWHYENIRNANKQVPYATYHELCLPNRHVQTVYGTASNSLWHHMQLAVKSAGKAGTAEHLKLRC